VADGEKAIRPLQAFGNPLGAMVAPQKYAAFQTAFDPLLTPGSRNYWKSHNFRALPDAALGVILERAGKLPTDQSEIFLAQMGGATSRVPAAETAYAGRDAQFIMNVHTRWEKGADDERCVRWARELFSATAPFATGGVYVNFMPDDEQDRVKSAYGANYDRLAAVKKTYDPENLFSLNQNIRPR
jgi:hypothetical protein